MREHLRRMVLVAVLAVASSARAEGFSTSAANPTAAPSSGVIIGHFPAGQAEASSYFVLDLTAGELVTQISIQGGAQYKSLDFSLLDGGGRRIDAYYITAGSNDNGEAARTFPIDSSGRYLVKLTTKGPETTSFHVELGGSALPNRQPAAAAPGFSRSYLAPTPVSADGTVAGSIPGGGPETYYYFSVDLKAGDLLTQMSVTGRQGADKWATLALLRGDGRIANSYFLHRTEANADATRSFPIDNFGRHIVRLAVKGPEGARFRIEFGGTAFSGGN